MVFAELWVSKQQRLHTYACAETVSHARGSRAVIKFSDKLQTRQLPWPWTAYHKAIARQRGCVS